jgi:hypothetical protein
MDDTEGYRPFYFKGKFIKNQACSSCISCLCSSIKRA